MDVKKPRGSSPSAGGGGAPLRRPKRPGKVAEENFWDCSVCTFRNTAEAFKCLMCDVRKGTSTRKPRLNPQLVAQHTPPPPTPPPSSNTSSNSPGGGALNSKKKRQKASTSVQMAVVKQRRPHRRPARLKNVDRSTAQTREVTVNSVTVVITEYKPKVSSVNNHHHHNYNNNNNNNINNNNNHKINNDSSTTSTTTNSSSDHGSHSESSMDATR